MNTKIINLNQVVNFLCFGFFYSWKDFFILLSTKMNLDLTIYFFKLIEVKMIWLDRIYCLVTGGQLEGFGVSCPSATHMTMPGISVDILWIFFEEQIITTPVKTHEYFLSIVSVSFLSFFILATILPVIPRKCNCLDNKTEHISITK